MPVVEEQLVVQPRVEPSPCLRKSVITKEIKDEMDPLGLAKSYNHTRRKEYVRAVKTERVYKGNPFAEILWNRGHSWVFENKNDLSNLEDLPTSTANKHDPFVVQADTSQEELVILLSKEDPSRPLDFPGQPPYFRIPLSKLRDSECFFATLLDERDEKRSSFSHNSIVYSFDDSLNPNIYIQEYAIYIDTLMVCDMARAHRGYWIIESLTTTEIWKGLRPWADWASQGFRPSYTEEDIKNAIFVCRFVRDMFYSSALYGLIDRRKYYRSYSSIAEMWPELDSL
ncbi:hypothetical protein IFR05_010505 [Cadophora sp. M221]|nr:hypothetical protein IFR05_010505 [Cadophora sp. M221]